MSYRTTKDILKATLRKAGELTDGSSSYHTHALDYINTAYRSLLSGGAEFGIDITDAWNWAISRRPIVLALNPPITGSVTMTLNSADVTLSAAQALSLDNYVLKLDSYDELYSIRGHTAGGTTFNIDQPYTGTTGTYSFTAYQFDYDLVDNSIVIDQFNNKIDFQEGGATVTATLTYGNYTPTAFAAHISTKMMEVGGLVYNHSFNPINRLFTWSATGNFSLLFGSGPNADQSPSFLMGLGVDDYVNELSYTSDYALNAIDRLIAPMQVYGRRNNYADAGQVFEVDLNTFNREHSIRRTYYGVPDRYCIIGHKTNGIVTVRFNGVPAQSVRLEIPYIPTHQDLTDTVASVPIIPLGFRDYLVHAGAYFLMVDKSDNKADTEAGLAKAKLIALQNHNRRSLSLAGTGYGRLVPRSR